jgi:AP endonuclease-1
MSRRSTRIAKRAGETACENEISPNKSSMPSKRKRSNLDKKMKVETSDEITHDEKQQLGNTIEIKEEKDEGFLKMKHELPEDKITKEGKYVGAHVSISGGLHLAARRALDIGAKSFAMFLRSQRQWAAKPLDPKNADLFKTTCKDSGFSPNKILPHGIYLMNCGSPDPETLTKSRQVLVDELKRCEMLGLTLYNFHPGSTCGKISVEKCLDLIGESINMAHQQTKFVVTVLENMSCQGNTVRKILFVELPFR